MSSLKESEVQEIYKFAIELSRKAGRAIVEGSSRRFSSSAGFDQKKNTADLVTETDQAVEALVKKEISAKFPNHAFIGEESWAAGEEGQIGSEVTWIVDPIDGTTNFVHGFPYTCISIGVVMNQQPYIGVVYAPFLDTLYHACKGQGSFVSSPHHPVPQRLPLHSPLVPLADLNQALVAFEWGSDRRAEILDRKLASFRRITGDSDGGIQGGKFAQGVRSIGSAALNFCHVASGSLDLYWEIGCWAWDVCAGIVIAQEAGAAIVGSKQHATSAIQAPSTEFNLVTPQVLTGRKYVVVRAINQDPELNTKAQKHILAEFYSCIDEWDP